MTKKKPVKKTSKAKTTSPKKTASTAPTEEVEPKRKARIVEAPKLNIPPPQPEEAAKQKKAKPEKKIEKAPVEPSDVPEKPDLSEQKQAKKKPKKEEKEVKEAKSKPAPKKETTYPQKKGKLGAPKDFHEFRATVKRKTMPKFDSRDRLGLRDLEEGWRKKRRRMQKRSQVKEVTTIRPESLKIRLPITLKDLAQEMKLKASQLVSKLFLQGITLTLNDYLDDETTVQLLGQEFDCDITIDTSEEERLRITSKTIEEEIKESDTASIEGRPPIIAFMGHVDHGKTSLIDAIRKSSITSSEAGEITQHIGAFKSKTALGEVTILDTPGHEAFSQMRARGANVTDVVVLVVAGDEGIKDQTLEAIEKARTADTPMVVAINKADKANFDEQKVFRQLADMDLLPEAWGGTVITINTSIKTGEGIKELLEMVILQSEVLELKANPNVRARGIVLEAEMHKGLGSIATVLVLNGTLRKGDALVFGNLWGRVKTMHNEHAEALESAPPATPVRITGLSGLPEAGCDFIVVAGGEKEAKELAEARKEGMQRVSLQAKPSSLEGMLDVEKKSQKILPIILRADVQGSLEALKNSLLNIKTNKIRLEIVSEDIGEISESEVELAAASKALVLGFHTRIEASAEPLIKQKGITVLLHNIIYHAVDAIKEQMILRLDKIEEEKDMAKADVKTTFKSSQLGIIAGCVVSDGVIKRGDRARLLRNGEMIWKGKISSLKRVKEDVKEVQKGLECGILLEGFSDINEGDEIQTYDIIYHTQEL